MSVHDADYAKVKKALGIPEDEPIFVIRGQDTLAPAAVQRYYNLARMEMKPPPREWFERLDGTIEKFSTWQAENKDKVKVPD